jgi:hypothetical protein
LEYYSIVIELTSTVTKNDIAGIDNDAIVTLKKHHFQSSEWVLALALEEIMAPFFTATKMLSIRTRQTGGDGFIVLKQIQHFLTTAVTSSSVDENDDNFLSSGRRELNNLKTEAYYNVVNRLKKILLSAFNFYTGKHISPEMKQALLVNTYELLINQGDFSLLIITIKISGNFHYR